MPWAGLVHRDLFGQADDGVLGCNIRASPTKPTWPRIEAMIDDRPAVVVEDGGDLGLESSEDAVEINGQGPAPLLGPGLRERGRR
jgi:hypothetical protein